MGFARASKADDVACVLTCHHVASYVHATWCTHGTHVCALLVVKRPLRA